MKRLTIAWLALFTFLGLAQPVWADGERSLVHLAQIKLSGDLDEAPVASDPLFGTSAENFKSKLDRLNKAKNDKVVQGVLLNIDSLSVGKS